MNKTYNSLKLFSTLLIVQLTFSMCSNLPQLDIDTAKWKQDREGCLGLRSTMIETMEVEKEKLLGLDEMQLVKLLGKPDRNELYKRNQKFFFYYFDATANCATPINSPRKLEIRLNALGLAKEVSIE